VTRTEVRRRLPRTTGLVLAAVALLLVVGSTLAVHDPTGPMELDGNIADAAGGGTDWQAIFDAAGNETSGVPAGTLDTTGVIRDFVPGASGPDISYHEPSNKDDQPINPDSAGSVWGCVSVPNPTDKTDIVNAYGMAVQGDAETGDGDDANDQLFYFGVERFDNSGDAFIGLWLFQDDVSCDPATGKFEGSKQTGDILVLANFTGGGSNALIQLFNYTAGEGDDPGTFDQLASVTGKCETTSTGDIAANTLCATINDTTAFVTPWAMEDKTKPGPPSPDPAREVDPDQFVEGGVNLTRVFEAADLTAPTCFGSFLAETRSSSSLDATLKDYALGDLSFCDANISITPTETNRVGEQHTFTVDVDQLIGATETAAQVGDVEYTLTGSNGITADDIEIDGGTCVNGAGVEDDLDADGRCTIIFHSDKTGVITGHATVDVNIAGTILTRATDGQSGNSGDAVKTYVDATIDIAGDDTNRVNDPHTFTVTVKTDSGDGNGLQPASGVVVTPTLTDTNGATAVVDDTPDTDTTCDDGTNSSGVCVVKFVSSTTGVTTGTASASVTVGGLTFTIDTTNDATATASQDATKTWVDARIGITGDDTNSIEEAHTFTVLLEEDLGDGNGFVPAADEDVDVTLTNSLGAGYVVDATATTCDVDAVNTDADTDSDGECVAVFTSDTAGTVTGSATSAITVGGVLINVSTDDTGSTGDAVKGFVDGSIRWLKHDGDGELLGGATFEVCRTHRLDSSAGTYVVDPAAEADRCFTILDNDSTDNDPTDGELEVIDLVLGRYTVEETIPPTGFHIANPPGAGPFTFPDMTIADPDVDLATIFVNIKAYRLIVITCDDITDTLVVSEVDLDGEVLDTISADDLAAFNLANGQDLTEAQICGIGGASYGELPDATYTPSVELPKLPEALIPS
jgi:hypothetical protein